MGLGDHIKKILQVLRSNSTWVKSATEKKLERIGYKLVDSHPSDRPVELDYDAVKERFGEGDILVLPGAYDRLACHQPGKSLYVKKPELVDPAEVVWRDWNELKDRPHRFGKLVEYAAQLHQAGAKVSSAIEMLRYR